jgi:hypothetical protein
MSEIGQRLDRIVADQQELKVKLDQLDARMNKIEINKLTSEKVCLWFTIDMDGLSKFDSRR